MADSEAVSEDELSKFLKTGIYRLRSSNNAVFVDPVRVLNRYYTRFRVCPSRYYARFFESKHSDQPSVNPRKRKRIRKRKVVKLDEIHALNQRERAADRRHQEVRPWLVGAYDSFLRANELLLIMPTLKNDGCFSKVRKDLFSPDVGQCFLDLQKVWQAPLYEITLDIRRHGRHTSDGGSSFIQANENRVLPIFDNMVENETNGEVEAEFLDSQYIIPRESCFYMSDLGKIQSLTPGSPDFGFNLIVIDPPWENGSARQKSMYPTLPNRNFLSLPIKQLSHTEGALVALWVTNREKLRDFIEKELFRAWGVTYVATLYWLKVKANGSLISDLDLFHHRPYECLLLGYCHPEVMNSKNLSSSKHMPDNQVVISIPGDYSRKPPLGELLMEYIPGVKPARCIELFAREMMAGWTSWGNEPLRFQDSMYFQRNMTDE